MNLEMKNSTAQEGSISLSESTEPKIPMDFSMSHAELLEKMRDMVNEASASETSLVFTSKEGVGVRAPDLNALKKKGELAPWIRRLYGEYRDPEVNYMRTTVIMASLLEKTKFEHELLKTGLGSLITKNRTNLNTAQIKAGQSSGALKNLWVNPEMHAMMFSGRKSLWSIFGKKATLEGTQSKSGKSKHAGEVVFDFVNAQTKANLTIFKDDSQSRNFLGAAWNLWQTGHLPIGLLDAIAVNTHDFTKSQKVFGSIMSPLFGIAYISSAVAGKTGAVQKAEIREQMEEMVKYRLMDESVEASLISELVDGIYTSEANTSRWRKGKSKFAKGYKSYVDTFAKPYQATDAIFKKIQFDREVKNLTKAGLVDQKGVPLTTEQIKQMAADLVRSEQPTYSESPEILQAMSRNIFMSPFINFTAQVYRTRVNIVSNTHRMRVMATEQEALGNEKGAKVLRGMTRKRFAGYVTGFLSTMLSSALSMYATGRGEDDDEALSWLMPDYNKHQSRIYTNSDKKNPSFIDMSFVDPNSSFYKIAIASMREDNLLDGIYAGGAQFFDPFVSEEVFASQVKEAIFNKNSYGGTVTNASGWKGFFGGLAHVAKTQIPGYVNSGMKITQSALGAEREDSGLANSWQNEVLNSVIGIKIKKYKTEKTYTYAKKAVNEELLRISSSYKTYLRDWKKGDSEEKSNENLAIATKKIAHWYKGMKTLGWTDHQIENDIYRWDKEDGSKGVDHAGLKLLEHAKQGIPPKINPEKGTIDWKYGLPKKAGKKLFKMDIPMPKIPKIKFQH
jgi:hypothetical protein